MSETRPIPRDEDRGQCGLDKRLDSRCGRRVGELWGIFAVSCT